MHAAAERFVTTATAAVRASGRFLVALSGGATPLPLYSLLASKDLRSAVDWPCVHVFWVDERCVPPDHAASNYRAVQETLLDRVEVPERNVHRIRGEDEPTAAAVAYERELRSIFSTADGPPRHSAGARFDLVLLGMGDDGHTASLFPSSPALRERQLWVMAQQVEGAPIWRVTLTPPRHRRRRGGGVRGLGYEQGRDAARACSKDPIGPTTCRRRRWRRKKVIYYGW